MARKPPYLICVTICPGMAAAYDILLSRAQLAERFPEWVALANDVRRTGRTASVHCDAGQAYIRRSNQRES